MCSPQKYVENHGGVLKLLKIVICDDERSVFEQLKDYILRYSMVYNIDISQEVLYYANAAELLNAEHNYNILFLDIMLGKGLNGIEVGKQLREMGNTAMFIMVTSREDLALKGYEATVFRYLVKPVSQDEIYIVLDDAVKAMEYDRNIVEVKFGKTRRLERVKDILYLEDYKRARYLITKSEKYQISATSNVLLEQLSSLHHFFRARASHLINLAHVTEIVKEKVVMSNGDKIILPKERRKEFSSRLFDFLKFKG